MKKLLIALLVFMPLNAYADEAWVKVDANGKAIGGAIVCSASVCGDPNSTYSKLTLQPGERYVMQMKAQPDGNVVGIGNNNPNTEVKVNLQTNEWTVTHSTQVEIKSPVATDTTPSITVTTKTVEKFNPTVETPKPTPTVTPTPVVQPTVTDTPTVITPVIKTVVDTPTVTTQQAVDSLTVVVQETVTATEQVIVDPLYSDWLENIKKYLQDLLKFITGWFWL